MKHPLDIILEYGQSDYFGEAVSQIEHMAQTAEWARMNRARPDMIIACLLHDIGHLLPDVPGFEGEHEAMEGGLGMHDHDLMGGEYLRQYGFSDDVCELVAGHVAAKRYLCATRPDYYARLTEASKQTLAQQGGPMSEDEINTFEANRLFVEKVQLREWEEEAKVVGEPLPDWAWYRELIDAHLAKQREVRAVTV